jgi:hypothetical protein
MNDRVWAVFAERLRAAGAPAPEATARTLLVHLLGAIVEQSIDPGSGARLRDDVARLCGVRRPRSGAVS